MIPLKCNYVLRNTGTEPAILTSVNTATMVMDLFHDHGFVFDIQDGCVGGVPDVVRPAV